MQAADYSGRTFPDRQGQSAARYDQYTPPDLCTSGKYAMRRTDAAAEPDTTPETAPSADRIRAPPHFSARRTAAADALHSTFPGTGSGSRERRTGAVLWLPYLLRLAVMGCGVNETGRAAVSRAAGPPSASFPPRKRERPAGTPFVVFLNTAIITQVYVSFYNTLKIFSQALESFWLKASCKT